MVNDAFLNIGFGEGCFNRIRYAGKTVYANNKNVLNPRVSEFIKDIKLEFCTFVFANPDAENILFTVDVNAKNHVGCFANYLAV